MQYSGTTGELLYYSQNPGCMIKWPVVTLFVYFLSA